MMPDAHVPQSESTNRLRGTPTKLSEYSSAPIASGLLFANDFMLGAGMVIIQPSSGKVVLVCDTAHGHWFLPRGRKDVGESLEQAALREAYEEVRSMQPCSATILALTSEQTGYRPSFLPVFMPTNAPGPSSMLWIHQRAYGLPCTEPIYITSTYWGKRRPAQIIETEGGMYLTFWYIGQIAESAVCPLITLCQTPLTPDTPLYRTIL